MKISENFSKMQERYLFLQDSQSADLCYLKKTVLKLRQWILDQLEAMGGGGVIAFI